MGVRGGRGGSLGLAPWASGEHELVLEIATTIVTGYQIARGADAPGGVR
ncbi:MAG TPA: hypothetical protein VHX15_08045 [Frankiaceae bacterium]|jgi:hypothetical protein|nr:hypothetical protein [Frankiaceae bacterium]